MAKEYKVKTLKNGEKRYIFDVNIGYRADGSRIRKTVTSKTVKDGREKVKQLFQRMIYLKMFMIHISLIVKIKAIPLLH